MNLYLDSPALLLGGIACVVIGALIVAFLRGTIGTVIGGVFGIAGVLSMLYSFAGSGLRPVQFIIACGLVGFAGVILIKGGGLAAKVIGVAVVVLALFAIYNTVTPLSIPFLDQDYAANVEKAFRTTGDVLEAVFDRATENDPRPRRQEPIP